MTSRTRTICAGLLFIGIAIIGVSCAPEPIIEEVKVEVTRQVEVVQQVVVTQEVVKEIIQTVEPPTPAELATEYITSSLHGTTAGMGYFYSKEQGGFETLTGVPYSELPCQGCHTLYNQVEGKQGQPRCESCHISGDYAPPQASVKLPGLPDDGRAYGCLSCHRRQAFEYAALNVVLNEKGQPVINPVTGAPFETPGIVDVHSSAPPNGKGLVCVNCHGTQQTHGDGNTYQNLFDSPDAQCADCHPREMLGQNAGHLTHGENMTCAACHAATVISCQGCHLNGVMRGGPEFPNARVSGLKFLIKNQEGKIDLANLMTAAYTDDKGDLKTIAVLSPYYDHSIRSFKGQDINEVCAECHNSPNVKAYEETGQIVISRWDDRRQQMTYPVQGVAPIPMDYQQAFQITIPYITNIDEVIAATRTGKSQAEIEAIAIWGKGDTTPDLWQMNYGTPLDRLPPQTKFDFPASTPASP